MAINLTEQERKQMELDLISIEREEGMHEIVLGEDVTGGRE